MQTRKNTLERGYDLPASFRFLRGNPIFKVTETGATGHRFSLQNTQMNPLRKISGRSRNTGVKIPEVQTRKQEH
jgi:hypothetical protein